jgi:hypothetical protein
VHAECSSWPAIPTVATITSSVAAHEHGRTRNHLAWFADSHPRRWRSDGAKACFNCDEKFVRDHKYAHLFFIEYDDMTPDDNATAGDAPADDEPRITLYAVAGVKVGDMVCLHVIINGQEFLELVNSNSSHNFI